MSTIRVFLLTCRRPTLLKRALESLLAQTFQDWICELHNDAPEDDSPRRLVETFADARITLHHHERNWGAVAALNHAYACRGDEPFGALLEDDNWWEPDFLAAAHATLQQHTDAVAVWANMRIWRELADGRWEDSGHTIWSGVDDLTPRVFRGLHPLQFSDALHSHGAMLFRAAASRKALVPADTPLAVVEPARERLLAGAWVLLPRPLANFSLTRTTARSSDPAAWMQAQLLVAGSYLAAAGSTREDWDAIWNKLRAEQPPGTSLMFHLAAAGIHRWAILRRARFAEALRFAAGVARHPAAFARTLRFRESHPEAWAAMCRGACERLREYPASDSRDRVVTKNLSSMTANSGNPT